MDCVFCKIANGELPCMKVYEDAHSLVFMDIAQDVDGHMLAIPKRHVGSILDCDAETFAHLAAAVKAVSDHCVGHCGYDGINFLNASGESAGQSVPHFHIHIIPRKRGDGVDAWPKFGGAKADLTELWKQLKM